MLTAFSAGLPLRLLERPYELAGGRHSDSCLKPRRCKFGNEKIVITIIPSLLCLLKSCSCLSAYVLSESRHSTLADFLQYSIQHGIGSFLTKVLMQPLESAYILPVRQALRFVGSPMRDTRCKFNDGNFSKNATAACLVSRCPAEAASAGPFSLLKAAVLALWGVDCNT